MVLFVDKCLPFGSSISCAHFQAFSNAVAHLVKHRTGKDLMNYLDDYLFAALLSLVCDNQIQTFLDVCALINFPVSVEKMFWSSTQLVFLGMLLNTVDQTVSIPTDKIKKGLDFVNKLLEWKSKKMTVEEVQQLCGFLNFLCRAVVPGRVFTRRLYSLTAGNPNLKQHHHVRMNNESRQDLLMLRRFLTQPTAFCQQFLDFEGIPMADELDFYTDAAKSFSFGGYFNRNWQHGQWNRDFIEGEDPSIAYLELFGVTAGVLSWADGFRNRGVIVFCDNMSAVQMINSSSSKCKNCMVLI